MKNSLRKTNFNNRIISFAMILGLFIISLSGCQQVNDAVNKVANTNATTNSKTTANTNSDANANSDANSNVTANSNSNANISPLLPSNTAANTNSQASNNVANTATAKEETPMTPEVKAFKVNLVGEWKTTDGQQVWRFDESKVESKFTNQSNFQNPLSYRIVDEKTIEFKDQGTPKKATITFENNGNDLLWVNQGDGRSFKLTRANPK